MFGEIRKIVFNDEIILWWDRFEYENGKPVFEVALAGGEKIVTDKTHAEFTGLKGNTEYNVTITAKNNAGDILDEKSFIVLTSDDKKILDVTKPPYNAVKGGKVINTEAIQRAIDDCDEKSLVYVPEGEFLTGALFLKDNVQLYVAKGGVLKGTSDIKDYTPKIKSRFEGLEMECFASLINAGNLDAYGAPNCKNIVIRGGGVISGGGNELCKNTIDYENERLKDYIKSLGDEIKTYENEETIPGRARGRLVNLSNCENVVVSGVTLENAPSWNMHMIYCDNIVTCGCTFRSFGIHNGDGWDPDSSENCTAFNCVFDTGDDCVAIKSGKNPEGNVINRPCKNIRLFDLKAVSGHAVAIGSEMSGGIENVFIWDCDLKNTVFGLHIKGTKKRGGYIKNIYMYDTVLPCVIARSVTYNDDGASGPNPPDFSNFLFDNVVITGVCKNFKKEIEVRIPMLLTGFGDDYPINDVKFKNVTVLSQPNDVAVMQMKHVTGLSFENFKVCEYGKYFKDSDK